MAIEVLFSMFLRAQLGGSLAVLLILALRLPVRRILGAELTYALWRLAPAGALISLFPTLPVLLHATYADGMAPQPGRLIDWSWAIHHAAPLAPIWLTGAVLMGALFAYGQWRFDRSARAGRAGPAATGFWPRMVVPADYAERFTQTERVLIRDHERAHMERRDPATNLLIAFLQTIGWFNPLFHLAARCARMDQELSIDAKVIALHPLGRRRYAETLLKAHARGLNSPLACALALGGLHPLEVRLAQLGVRRISIRRDLLGVFAIGALGVALVLALWILAPI